MSIDHDEGIERELASAQGMQKAQAHKVVVWRACGLEQGERKGRVGRENMGRRVVAEDKSLERGRNAVQVWECGAGGAKVRG